MKKKAQGIPASDLVPKSGLTKCSGFFRMYLLISEFGKVGWGQAGTLVGSSKLKKSVSTSDFLCRIFSDKKYWKTQKFGVFAKIRKYSNWWVAYGVKRSVSSVLRRDTESPAISREVITGPWKKAEILMFFSPRLELRKTRTPSPTQNYKRKPNLQQTKKTHKPTSNQRQQTKLTNQQRTNDNKPNLQTNNEPTTNKPTNLKH